MTDRNIVDLAHAVLDAVVPDVPWKIQLQEFQARAAAAPALARAVIDLTAKVERMEALAKGLDHEADMIEAEGSDGVEAYVDAARSDAYRIRKALNGEIR